MADPPDEIAPAIDSVFKNYGGLSPKYNWSVTKVNTEIIGTAMRQDVQFTLSGYKGWNKLIYNKLSTVSIKDNRFEKLG